ncbi:MAG: hypothetical protein ACLR6T_07120 [Intestinibacter sp.]
MTLRILSDREKAIISKRLKKYGYLLEGGSVEDGNYHLSLNTHGAATTGNNLGPDLKSLLNAKSIFLQGIKIA